MSLSTPLAFPPTEQENLKYQCGMCNPVLRLLHVQRCKVPTVLTYLLGYLWRFLELTLHFHLLRPLGKPIAASFVLQPNANISHFLDSVFQRWKYPKRLFHSLCRGSSSKCRGSKYVSHMCIWSLIEHTALQTLTRFPADFYCQGDIFGATAATFSQASCLATDLVENLFLFISCAAGGRRGRMQNVMIWIFPFSALVSVQNIKRKVVGRKEKKKKSTT